MVLPRPFISDATEARIKQLVRRGSATTQVLQDPLVLLTFVRGAAEAVQAADVRPITIELDDTQAAIVGDFQGAQETTVTGHLEAWAEHVGTVIEEDRFSWDGRPCRITVREPESNGVVTMRFERLS